MKFYIENFARSCFNKDSFIKWLLLTNVLHGSRREDLNLDCTQVGCYKEVVGQDTLKVRVVGADRWVVVGCNLVVGGYIQVETGILVVVEYIPDSVIVD
jgi:hypothetical protein